MVVPNPVSTRASSVRAPPTEPRTGIRAGQKAAVLGMDAWLVLTPEGTGRGYGILRRRGADHLDEDAPCWSPVLAWESLVLLDPLSSRPGQPHDDSSLREGLELAADHH